MAPGSLARGGFDGECASGEEGAVPHVGQADSRAFRFVWSKSTSVIFNHEIDGAAFFCDEDSGLPSASVFDDVVEAFLENSIEANFLIWC